MSSEANATGTGGSGKWDDRLDGRGCVESPRDARNVYIYGDYDLDGWRSWGRAFGRAGRG